MIASALPFDMPAGRPMTPSERFEQFHRHHRDVYRQLVRLARTVKRRQERRGEAPGIGIAMLYERLRWHYFIQRRAGESYKLNNDYRAYYARLIMQNEPDLAGFFRLREQRHV